MSSISTALGASHLGQLKQFLSGDDSAAQDHTPPTARALCGADLFDSVGFEGELEWHSDVTPASVGLPDILSDKQLDGFAGTKIWRPPAQRTDSLTQDEISNMDASELEETNFGDVFIEFMALQDNPPQSTIKTAFETIVADYPPFGSGFGKRSGWELEEETDIPYPSVTGNIEFYPADGEDTASDEMVSLAFLGQSSPAGIVLVDTAQFGKGPNPVHILEMLKERLAGLSRDDVPKGIQIGEHWTRAKS